MDKKQSPNPKISIHDKQAKYIVIGDRPSVKKNRIVQKIDETNMDKPIKEVVDDAVKLYDSSKKLYNCVSNCCNGICSGNKVKAEGKVV